MVTRKQLILALALLVAWVGGASAASHLLLIGVERYPALAANRQLRGVSNDLALLRDTLGRLLQPITLVELSDRPEAGGRATRGAIGVALQEAAAKAQAGDWVVLYAAGHGTQAPAIREAGNVEADGLDEVFLPGDIEKWDAQVGVLRGGLYDNTLRQWAGELARKQVSLWLIFDSCHAGDMAKAYQPGSERRLRSVPPAELGIPPARQKAAVRPLWPDRVSKGGGARLVAFYATQANESTYEEPVRLADGRVRSHGIFSYTLARALDGVPPPDIEAVAQRIRASYRDDGRLFPHPAFEGALIGSRPWASPSPLILRKGVP